MKTTLFTLLAAAALTLGVASCTGNNTGQQAAPVATEQAPAAATPAPVPDSTAAAQPQAPAATQAQALPQAINDFLKQHFSGATVAYIEPDQEYGGLHYDLTLNDGTEVDFDANNQWDKVDCHTHAVPAALVPANIANYVKTNYQALPITKIDREPYGYEIELSNGLDLRFAANGQFMGIDD